ERARQMVSSGSSGDRSGPVDAPPDARHEDQAPHRMKEPFPIPTRRLAWPPPDATGSDELATREWLVTNGLGGYASGTIAGVITRRYHGYLIAALPAPLGRMVMLSHIAVQVRYPDGRRVEVGGREQLQPSSIADTGYLVEF